MADGASRNLVTLKEYTDSRLATLKEYIEARLCAIERAITIANEAMNNRLEGMNEFRGALKDQTAQLVPRVEFEAEKKAVSAELQSLRDFKTGMEAKASQQSVYIALALSLAGLALGIVSLFR